MSEFDKIVIATCDFDDYHKCSNYKDYELSKLGTQANEVLRMVLTGRVSRAAA